MIEISGLTKSYGDKVIFKNLTFSVRENVCTAFTGDSGIGKTTLLRCITGLEKPDTGHIDGVENKKITFVFQENRLLAHASVLENILCVAPDKQRAEYFLQRTGLADESRKKAGELSGGMKRRLAVARALAAGGDIYYLDEPLRELDEGTEEKILQLIKEEISGKTALLITHDSLHTAALADDIFRFAGSPMTIQ